MAKMQGGEQYRGRAVDGEITLKVNEKTGTRYVEVMVECRLGPCLGERVRYRGYVNSRENAEATAAELRAMGWRGQRWGDWSGIGTREIVFTVMTDAAADGKVYRRAAFVREVPRLSDKNTATAADLEDLNRVLGDVVGPRANGVPSAAPAPVEADAAEEIPF